MKNQYFYMRPILLCAIGFCIGIIVGYYFWGLVANVVACIVIPLSFFCLLFRKYKIFALLFFIIAGLWRILLAIPPLPAPADACLLKGTVCELPGSTLSGFSLTLSDVSVDGMQMKGRAILFIKSKSNAVPYRYGEKITATSSLELPQGARNEGGMDMRLHYLSQNIVCIARAKESAVHSAGHTTDFYGFLLALKERTTSILTHLVGPDYGPVAAAMLHGETKDIQEDTIVRFRNSGIAHLLAVSGLHVSLLCTALLFVLKRIQPLLQLVLISVFLAFYCMFTAFSPSTIRASIMVLCLLTGNVLERRNDPLCAISLSCILILCAAPFELFTAGFQLSFCAVLGILLLCAPFSRALQKLAPKGISDMLGASMGAQLGTIGPGILFFNRIPVFSLFSNLLVVPLAALAMLPAILALAAYPLSPALAQVFASVSGTTLQLMDSVAALTAQMGSLAFPSPTPAVCFTLFLAFAFLSDYFFGRKMHRRILAALSLALSLFLYTAPGFIAPHHSMTVLALQNGYAVHVRTGREDVLYGCHRGIRSYEVKGYMQYHNIPASHVVTVDAKELSLMLDKREMAVGDGYLRIGEITYLTSVNGQISVYMQNGIPVIQAYALDG